MNDWIEQLLKEADDAQKLFVTESHALDAAVTIDGGVSDFISSQRTKIHEELIRATGQIGSGDRSVNLGETAGAE